MIDDQSNTLIEQDLALDSFVETLLSDGTQKGAIQPEPELVNAEPGNADNIDPSTEQSQSHYAPEAFGGTRQTGLQLLPFSVNRIQLVVNMNDLAGTVDMVVPLTPVSGQPEWFAGLAEYNGSQVGIVDSARLILEGSRGLTDQTGVCDYKKVLLLRNGAWGIACDDVGESFWVESDEVRWRTKRQSRPWLLGTLVHQSCAMVDLDQLIPKGESKLFSIGPRRE